ncbi:MAG: hypothetical protein ACKVQS_02465 [Fimbriimonadaceae bacterium]
MKRLLTTALAALMVAGAFAQGTFTIRRPADGSKVREVVKVRIPKNSIPEGGYIGVLVNGKFLEAVIPDVEGSDYVYNLDTKARKIADGPMTIETVLYFYTQGAPQVLNRSSVNVVLDNSATIMKNAPNGFNLRYKFYPGKEYVYNMTEQSSVSFVTQAQAQLGSRAAEIVTNTESIRYLIAHANNYGTSGLIRMQALPTKGKDYAYIITAGETVPKKFMDYEMHPIFMKITDRGREMFTSLPIYFPWEGASVDARTDLFAMFPPSVLPDRPKSVGDRWPAAIPQGNINLEKKDEIEHMVENLPGSATLESVEWEQGFPCAKIRSELSLGANDLKNLKSLEGVIGQAQSLKIESIQWFAIDRGIMIREELRFTSEILVTVGASAGGAGAAGGGPSGGPTGLGSAGSPGGGQGGGASTAGGKIIRRNGGVNPGIVLSNNFFDQFDPATLLQQRGGRGNGPGGDEDGQEGGPPGLGGGEGFGAPGGRGGASAGSSVPVKVILRQTSRRSTVLEQ